MSSTGTETVRSQFFRDGGATISTGAEPARNCATSSLGSTVADSPIRWAGLGSSASSRSSDTARCAPRLVPATAWTSSTMIGVHLAEGFPGLGRQHQEERFRGGDEDVRRVAEQRAAVRRRRVPGPDAHGDERGGQVQAFGGLRDADQRRAEVAFDVDAERLERGNVQHAGAAGLPAGPVRPSAPGPEVKRERRLRGRRGDEGSSAQRNAASVLPEPVGATTRACEPEEMAFQAPFWAGVGAEKAPRNQSRVGRLKRSSTDVVIPMV